MAKLTLSDLASLANETSAIATINANNALIETALENTLSRDGTDPNTVSTNLDMDTNRIYNIAQVPLTNTDVASKYYVDFMVGESSDTTPTNPDDVIIEGDLQVDGNTTVGGTLDITGDVSIGGGDNTHTIAGASVTSNLEVHSEGSTDVGGVAVHRHTDTNNFGGHLLFLRSDGTHAAPSLVDDNDTLGRIVGLGHDGTDYELASEIRFRVDGTAANNAMPGDIGFFTNAGSQTITERMAIRADGDVEVFTVIRPDANDGATLGESSTAWSDLFLASGGTINWNAGNTTLTHSAGLLTSNVPLSLGTSNALTAGTIELGAATDTTLARSSAGNVSIEGNVIYRAGGTDVVVADGGTGRSSHTEYAVICGGTTTTDAQQSIASVGTAGQVLTSNGASALPTFQTAASGIVNAVASGAVSAAATLDIALSNADMYEIDLINFVPATDAQELFARFSQSSTFLSGVADYNWNIVTNGASSVDASDSEMRILDNQGNVSTEVLTVTLKLYRPSATSFIKSMIWHGRGSTATPTLIETCGGGQLLANTDAIDGVRFMYASGNIASGYYAVRSYAFS